MKPTSVRNKRRPLAIALAAAAAVIGVGCGGLSEDIGTKDQAVTGMDNSLEYALDAPWRMEPRGTGSNPTYEPIPIQVSFFDEAMTPSHDTLYRYGDLCSVVVERIDGRGDVTTSRSYEPQHFAQIETTRKHAMQPWFADNTTAVDTGRAYWEVGEAPPWRGFCRPAAGANCAGQFNTIYNSTEWHGLIKHVAVAPTPGSHFLYRLRAYVSIRGGSCDVGEDRIRFENWVNVYFARDPLPRFGSSWVYGDLHYHSQGTDNEGEVGFNYRGVVQAMSAIGLDFAFATEHASNGRQIPDMRFGIGWDAKLKDNGSIVRGLRDMSPRRFADHWKLLRRIAANGHDLPRLRNGMRPWLFLGGELDIQPEMINESPAPAPAWRENIGTAGNPTWVDHPMLPWYITPANGKPFDLTRKCGLGDMPRTLTHACIPANLISSTSDGAFLINDRQGFGDYLGSRQHLVYLPSQPSDNAFVPSNTSKFGGGTRRLTHDHNGQVALMKEVEQKGGMTFLAHPLSGRGNGSPGPESFPWTNHGLKQAFGNKAVAGLQFWNENHRLDSKPKEIGYDHDLVFQDPDAWAGHESRRFSLKPMKDDDDLLAWRFDRVTENAEKQLHNGGIIWDKMLLWGLDPVRATQLDWIDDVNQPRRVFAAAGSDAHGDFNYRRTGYAMKTDGITDTALGKVRNLVDVGSLTQDANTMQQRTFTALSNGRFSMTDGPAVRIAIDNNDNNVIDAGDTLMGGVMNLPTDRKLRVLVEWKSTSEFGLPDVLDLYVGAFRSDSVACTDDNCMRARIYAPINHGVRSMNDSAGLPVDPSQSAVGPRELLDGYWTPKYQGGRLLRFNVSNPIGENANGYHRSSDGMSGWVVRELSMDDFPTRMGAADRFYVRAFVRTKPTIAGCFGAHTPLKDNLSRQGRCLRRYGVTNPVWAVKPIAGPPWTHRVGSPGYHDTRHVATDAAGNVYVASQFTGTMTVDNYSLTAVGTRDVYVAKFDRTGNRIWTRHIKGSGAKSVEALTVNNQGRVAITGFVTGNMSFNGHNYNASDNDAFVITFLADSGHTSWWHAVKADNDQQGRAITFTPGGKLLMVGKYKGSLGSGWLAITSDGGYDCFLAEFSPTGTLMWFRSVGGGTGNCEPTGVATNSNSDVIVSAHYSGQVVVDVWNATADNTHVAGSTADGFIAAFGSNLQYKWHTRLSTPWSRVYPYDVATDGQGRVYVAGAFDGLLYVDDGTTSSPVAVQYAGSKYKAYVLKLDADGTYTTGNVQKMGGTGHDYAYSIDVTSDGRYCVAGRFYSSQMRLGDTYMSRHGAFNGFVAGFGADDSVLFADEIARYSGTANASSCAIASDGSVAVAGKFHNRAMLDGNQDIYSTGGWDGIIGVYRSHLE